MSEPPLLLQREPPVATVVFNRPEARNTLNEAMQLALPPLLVQLREDADIRVLILRGAGGRAFAAGIAAREE
jgi:enoyl-CoA hydratase